MWKRAGRESTALDIIQIPTASETNSPMVRKSGQGALVSRISFRITNLMANDHTVSIISGNCATRTERLVRF